MRKPNPPDTLSTFFSPLKGIPGTHSNSTSLQHFLGLHSHSPLCQHSITNCWCLKWTKSATFPLQFIFCEFSKQGLLSIAGWELPPPSSIQALRLFLLSPSETLPWMFKLLSYGSNQITQMFPSPTLGPKSCLLGNTWGVFFELHKGSAACPCISCPLPLELLEFS